MEYVNAMQHGEDTRYLKTVCVAKHFADYDVEGNVPPAVPRKSFNAIVSDQDQVEYYWPAWQTTIENTGLQGIMCSYNNINGIPSCGNDLFLNGVVRNEWMFHGVIFSDGGAIVDDAFTQYVNGTYDGYNPQQQCRVAMEGGCDLNLGNFYPQWLPSAVQKGIVSESDIDLAVSRLFTRSFMLGKYDYVNPPYYNKYGPEYVDNEFNRKLAMNAAEQGIVLLKNDNNILPVKVPTNGKIDIAFIGPHFNITQYMLGSYRGANTLANKHSPYQAMMNYINDTNNKVSLDYAEGCDIVCNTTSGFEEAITMAKNKDYVFVFLGLYGVQYSPEVPYGLIWDAARESEGCDRVNITFPNYQLDLLRNISAVNDNVILVLFNSSPIDLTWPKENNNVQGILQCFYPGELGGDAFVNIIMGVTAPSGKLPITVYPEEFLVNRSIEDMGLSSNGGITYRYFDGPMVYPFAYGLYYTKFTYDYIDEMVERTKMFDGINEMGFTVKVTNVGNVNSDCIVLGFMKYEQPQEGDPNIKLFDFEKVYIKAGESVNATLSVSPDTLGRVDTFGRKVIKSGDEYRLFIGDYMNGLYRDYRLVVNGDDNGLFDFSKL